MGGSFSGGLAMKFDFQLREVFWMNLTLHREAYHISPAERVPRSQKFIDWEGIGDLFPGGYDFLLHWKIPFNLVH